MSKRSGDSSTTCHVMLEVGGGSAAAGTTTVVLIGDGRQALQMIR